MLISIFRIIQIVLTVAAIAYIALYLRTSMENFEINSSFFVCSGCALCFYIFGQIAAALRFAAIAKILAVRISFTNSFKCLLVGQLFNNVLPPTLGGDIGRMVYLSGVVSIPLGVKIILTDRVMGLIGLFVLLPVTLSYLYSLNLFDSFVYQSSKLVIGIFIFFTVTLALYTIIKSANINHFLITYLELFASHSKMILGSRAIIIILILSILTHALNALSFATITTGIFKESDFLGVASIAPAIQIFAALPITSGGWGSREAASAWLLSFAGHQQPESMLASVVYGAQAMILGLLGLRIVTARRLISSGTEKIR